MLEVFLPQTFNFFMTYETSNSFLLNCIFFLQTKNAAKISEELNLEVEHVLFIRRECNPSFRLLLDLRHTKATD